MIQEQLVWWLFSLFTAPIFHQESIKDHLICSCYFLLLICGFLNTFG